jgi:hypothetical protein
MNTTLTQPSVLQMMLTNGIYTPEEARDIVSGLLKAEVAFHKLQNYKWVIQHDDQSLEAQENLERLAGTTELLQSTITEAIEENQMIKVETVIRLTIAN